MVAHTLKGKPSGRDMMMIKNLYLWHLKFRSSKHLNEVWKEAIKTHDFDILREVSRLMNVRLAELYLKTKDN